MNNAQVQEPVYRKVAIVENFFDIIYTVHVELEGRPGKHAGQKRTYRTITETYAFLPREAVTRFLTGCAECARRPRSTSPPPLPTPSPSPTRHTSFMPFIPRNSTDYTRNWETEIDAAHAYYEPKYYTELQPIKSQEENELTYIELTPKKLDSNLYESAVKQVEPVKADPDIDKEDSLIDVEDVKADSGLIQHNDTRSTENIEIKAEKRYNPLDVANLTSPCTKSPLRKKLLLGNVDQGSSYSKSPKPWKPDGSSFGEDIDYNVPITTTYLKHFRRAFEDNGEQEHLTADPGDINEDDSYSNRNGDMSDTGTESMADLWASYHNALGLGTKPPKAPTPMATGQSSPILMGSISGVEPASTHDETSSSDRTKDDDDGGASDDDSDDRVDPQHHDPERLKAFNMFVRLFVDENLDRIVPISKQPKEKIQAIIDSCTRQFPEFAERARKRIRTYLKSCRRNKKVRGEGPTGNGNSAGPGSSWDTAVRPTPAHLTSVQAEHILAQACENESLNAKRMRLGLDPVSQPMPSVPTPMALDTTAASSAAATSFLSLYTSGAINPTTTTSSLTSGNKMAADTTRPSGSPTIENALLNNNSLKIDNANGSAGSKAASPASSPAPLFRPSFPTTFGTPQTFGRQSVNNNAASAALSSNALLSTLSAMPTTGVGVNAAMAAYQSALLSAMAAHTHTFPNNISAPTDLSVKNTSVTSHHVNSTSNLTTNPLQSKPSLMSHKLSPAEVAAVRQLITGYRESAAFLLRSADELEALLLNQA